MINGSTDVQSLALQFMQADRASQDQFFAQRQNAYQTQLKAYQALTSKINELHSTIDALADKNSLEAYSVTQSAEGYADITASGNAASGQYQINIDQLATAHQVALDFASETDPVATSGQLTLGLGGDTFNIDMASLGAGADLTDLRDAINAHADNPGVQASIVRTGGAVKLMLTSEETGAANVVSMTTNGDPAMADIQTAIDNHTELSQAQDARIYLGANQSLELTSASNSFDNAIDGLTIDLKKTHATAGDVLTFTVGQDGEATREQLQTLVDGYNAIVDTVSQKGVTGDSTARMLVQQLRRELSGSGISGLGLEFNMSGKLTLESGRLDDALAANPDALTETFGGDTGLLAKLDARLDTFTKGDDSLLKSSSNAVKSSLDQLQDRMDRFDLRMEQTYNRYVNQFSQMQSLVMQMQQTAGLF